MASQTRSTTKETGSGNGRGSEIPVRARVVQVRERADDLVRTVGTMAHEVHSALSAEVSKRPYRAMALATLAGFALGGGLSLAVLRGATRLGLRFALAALLNRAMGSQT